jgi:glycosyltransferase involved in cell wall biosynthesis
MKIRYISNISESETSGGMSGINSAVFNRFKKSASAFSYQYINPPLIRHEKLKSKFFKLLGIPRNYFFFSDSRLNKIRSEFSLDPECDFYFFQGFTPWVKTTPDKPYFCFNDGCFGTYLEYYNNKKEFRHTDIQRIFDLEKKWLENAAAVFFQSEWALNETRKHYRTSGENFYRVGVGGFIDIPKKDFFNGNKDFLFIAREFIPKGGVEAVEAIQLVRSKFPDVNLNIVGEKPEDQLLELPGIKYVGFLNKNDEKDLTKLTEVFSQAFALIHPTLKDINPLVINELAYFGCPAISSDKFAIPEYILNHKTGLLLNDPRDKNEIASKMIALLENTESYDEMRIQTRQNSLENNTWDSVLKRITKIILEKI